MFTLSFFPPCFVFRVSPSVPFPLNFLLNTPICLWHVSVSFPPCFLRFRIILSLLVSLCFSSSSLLFYFTGFSFLLNFSSCCGGRVKRVGKWRRERKMMKEEEVKRKEWKIREAWASVIPLSSSASQKKNARTEQSNEGDVKEEYKTRKQTERDWRKKKRKERVKEVEKKEEGKRQKVNSETGEEKEGRGCDTNIRKVAE